MKRKASLTAGGQTPAKLSKQSTKIRLEQKLVSVTREKTIEPIRSTSFRQRKAPSWLSSYVTNSSQEKEVKQAVTAEKPKLKMPRFPTLVPPSKRVKEEKKGENETGPTVPTLLRKRSTLKLESSSPPITDAKNKPKPALVPTPSLLRKPTKIITSLEASSPAADLKSKPTLNGKSKPSINGKKKSSVPKKDLSTTLIKRDKLKIPKTSMSSSSPSASLSPSSSSKISPKPGKKSSISRLSSSLRKIKEDTIPDSKVVELCDDPFNASTLPLSDEENDNDTDNVSNCSDITPPIKDGSDFKLPVKNKISPKSKPHDIPRKSSPPPLSYAHNKTIDQTILLREQSRPDMLEIVICISTSGALREYLQALQEHIREIIWRMQSLVPNLRIGVMAHTQGGIHDDPSQGTFRASDHNYNRAGGHSGTKWLDLGATLSQICAFVDSLESEPTVYPDYVQDNLEMALWKLQRCMSWSSCSYRSVMMIGRGRPNRTTFYHQKEHWRGWIRSALELPLSVDIPVIDWELEAKLLAEMGIHVFTIQAVSPENAASKDDEGTCFFRRVAEITQSQHVRIIDSSKLPEIIIGICCACHGSDLLLDHRETVRDENDGVLPTQLTEVFVGLQLHSKSNSLMSLPSMLRNLDLTSMRQRLNGYRSRMEKSMDTNAALENCMDYDSLRIESSMELEPIQEKEKLETTVSRSKTIRKMKTVKGDSNNQSMIGNKTNKDKKVNGIDNKRINGLNQRGNTQRSQGRSKPYEVGKRKPEMKAKAAGGVVDKFVKKLDSKAKKIVKKGDKAETAVKRLNSKGIRGESLCRRPAGKRQIKLSPKVRENLLSVKNGGLSKVKNKTAPVFTELKKKAVRSAVTSEIKNRGKPPPVNGQITPRRSTTTTVSASSSRVKNDIGKRKGPIVNGSAEKRTKRTELMAVKKGKVSKVSPLKRNSSVGRSSATKLVSNRKQQTVRNVRQRSIK